MPTGSFNKGFGRLTPAATVAGGGWPADEGQPEGAETNGPPMVRRAAGTAQDADSWRTITTAYESNTAMTSPTAP